MYLNIEYILLIECQLGCMTNNNNNIKEQVTIRMIILVLINCSALKFISVNSLFPGIIIKYLGRLIALLSKVFFYNLYVVESYVLGTVSEDA